MLAGLRDTLRASGLEPPSLRDLAVKLDASVETLRPLLAHLERERSVIRAPGDLYFDRAAVDALRARVVAALEEKGSLDTGAYKALIGTSRRTAVPLMELFDAERITLRAGEHRLLRRGR
jgi:selenocysteine-specific elongation factor